MKSNFELNRFAIKTISEALKDLNTQVVYVGGAVISMYIDDLAAEDVRPTMDVDLSMEIVSLSQLESVRQQLTQLGFTQSSEDKVICRFRYKDIKVDVMSTKEVGWAPANPWFATGHKKSQTFKIHDTDIRCLSLPYFLASKFSAYLSRGKNEPRASHDIEDIVYVMNYSSNFEHQILQSDSEVKDFLISCFEQICTSTNLQEAVLANLSHEDQQYRYDKIMTKLRFVCSEKKINLKSHSISHDI